MARLSNNTTINALMLVGGGVVGAGLALLLAPGSGRRTRREIARMGKAIGNKGDKAVRDLARKATELAGTVGDKAAGIMRKREVMIAG